MSDETQAPDPEAVAIHVALGRIFREVQAIPKSDRNAQQSYNFRGIDATQDALHDIFAKHGVIPLPNYRVIEMSTVPTRSGGTMEVITLEGKITFLGPAGDSVEVQTIGHASDSADKAANQAMQAALKYVLFQTFLIKTGDPDADGKTLERGAPEQNRSSASAPPAGPPQTAHSNGAPLPRGPNGNIPQGGGDGPRGVSAANAGKAASENQLKALYAISRRRGFDLHAFIAAAANGAGEKDLTMGQAGGLIEGLNNSSIDPDELIGRATQGVAVVAGAFPGAEEFGDEEPF